MSPTTGIPLTQAGLDNARSTLGVDEPLLWTVLEVETKGCGFLPDKRPDILFERHVFHRLTGGRFDAAHPDLSHPESGEYGSEGAHQHERLNRAVLLDKTNALKSASWGLGQVMGENAELAGYANVDAMVAAMIESEDNHLKAMTAYIIKTSADKHLKTHDWKEFARAYNGKGYKKNKYDEKLEEAYARLSAGPLPNLGVRAAQMLLRYLGLDPGRVDGKAGPRTHDAVRAYQEKKNLPATGELDDLTLAALKAEALA